MIKNKITAIFITALLICSSLSGCAYGKLSKEAVWYPEATKAQALKDLAEIERQKLALDKEKFALERRIRQKQ